MRCTLPLLAILSGCTLITDADWDERLSWWSAVSAEVDQSCGLRGDGTVDCWGALDSDWDQGVASDEGVDWRRAALLDAGYLYACVVLESGELYCFGDESNAEPGLISATPSGDEWLAVSAGISSACAIAQDNGVTCWGQAGEITDVPSDPFGQIDVGDGFACGITYSTGEVRCWGAEHEGRVSDTPGKGTWWYQVSAGYDFACAVGDDCSATCWGAEFTVPDAGTGCYERVEVGMDHACFLDDGGSLHCAGSDTDDQLQVPADDGEWVGVDVGANHSCGLTEQGDIRCWGNNASGQSAR